jgi:hypothetical protein
MMKIKAISYIIKRFIGKMNVKFPIANIVQHFQFSYWFTHNFYRNGYFFFSPESVNYGLKGLVPEWNKESFACYGGSQPFKTFLYSATAGV